MVPTNLPSIVSDVPSVVSSASGSIQTTVGKATSVDGSIGIELACITSSNERHCSKLPPSFARSLPDIDLLKTLDNKMKHVHSMKRLFVVGVIGDAILICVSVFALRLDSESRLILVLEGLAGVLMMTGFATPLALAAGVASKLHSLPVHVKYGDLRPLLVSLAVGGGLMLAIPLFLHTLSNARPSSNTSSRKQVGDAESKSEKT